MNIDLRTCAVCGSEITGPRCKVICSKKCSGQHSANLRGDAWRGEELALIERLADELPGLEIIKRLQRFQRRNGWKVRTDVAILLKLKRMKISRKPTLDNFSGSDLARLLGVDRERVRLWTRCHELPFRRIHRNCTAISTADFVEWAGKNPELVAGINPENLEWLGLPSELIEDVPTVRVVRSAPRPVRCVDTGEVFRSVKEAGRRKYVNAKNIPAAIARDGSTGGLRWEYVEVKS